MENMANILPSNDFKTLNKFKIYIYITANFYDKYGIALYRYYELGYVCGTKTKVYSHCLLCITFIIFLVVFCLHIGSEEMINVPFY